MKEFRLKLAEKVICAKVNFEETEKFCKDFLCSQNADIFIEIEKSDLEFEKNFSCSTSEKSLELCALYRKICHEMINFNTVLFHCSAIELNGNAYIFAAPSGTGKSTHTEKWRRLFGAKAINDDKPLIKIEEDVTVYGTPWMGKHKIGSNISAPLKVIYMIERSETNRLEPISQSDAFSKLMKQVYVPGNGILTLKTANLISSLSKKVDIYNLQCNMNDKSAKIALLGTVK